MRGFRDGSAAGGKKSPPYIAPQVLLDFETLQTDTVDGIYYSYTYSQNNNPNITFDPNWNITPGTGWAGKAMSAYPYMIGAKPAKTGFNNNEGQGGKMPINAGANSNNPAGTGPRPAQDGGKNYLTLGLAYSTQYYDSDGDGYDDTPYLLPQPDIAYTNAMDMRGHTVLEVVYNCPFSSNGTSGIATSQPYTNYPGSSFDILLNGTVLTPVSDVDLGVLGPMNYNGYQGNTACNWRKATFNIEAQKPTQTSTISLRCWARTLYYASEYATGPSVAFDNIKSYKA